MITDIPLSEIKYSTLRLAGEPNVDDILESFSRRGQLSPIAVRKKQGQEGYEVVYGSRRLAAARKLGWETIRASVLDVPDEEALSIAFAENSDRKDFTDYEKALVLKKLIELSGKSYSEIGRILGRSQAYVSQHIAMIHLFPEHIAGEKERETVLQTLTENHARILARIDDAEERWNTAKLALRGNLSVRELAKISGRQRAGRRSRSRRSQNALELRQLINAIVSGLSSKDITPLFDAVSHKHFGMFSAFPPFSLLDVDGAREYLCRRLGSMQEYKRTIESFEVHMYGKVAYAVLVLLNKGILGEPSSKSVTSRTRATIIFERDDHWRIVHAHWSPANPLEVDSVLIRAQQNTFDTEQKDTLRRLGYR